MASESARDGSIYDVLYADTRRLSSLLSQFSDDGLVTEMVRSAEDGTTTQASVNLKVVKGDAGSSGKRQKTQRFDPQWLLPLLFLDEAQDLIERDITQASIGSLVLVSGRMIVTDIRILQKLWSSPTTKKFVLNGLREAAKQAAQTEDRGTSSKAKNAAARNSKLAAGMSEAELTLEVLPLLPHSPQINIVTETLAAWSTIDPAYFVGAVEDLMLKHGPKLPGAWSMVGILDARPWEERLDGDYDDWLTFNDRLQIGAFTDNMWKVANDLAVPARQALGRPYLSYGVTPLIIFRELERPSPLPPAIVS